MVLLYLQFAANARARSAQCRTHVAMVRSRSRVRDGTCQVL